MTALDFIRTAERQLSHVSGSPRLDADLLLSKVLCCRREELYTNPHRTLTPDQLSESLLFLEQRKSGKPIAYIVQKKDFYKDSFFIKPGVLIPRPETELLVGYVLSWIHRRESLWGDTIRIIDLGAGSGAIALAISKDVKKVKALAVDNSKIAIEVIKENVRRLDLESQVEVLFADIDKASNDPKIIQEVFLKHKPFDIVVSNPPYIDFNDPAVEDDVKKHEPKEALFCGDEGLEKFKRWSILSTKLLKKEGLYIFEIGSGQGERAKQFLTNTNVFRDIQIHKDYSDRDRFISAVKSEQ